MKACEHLLNTFVEHVLSVSCVLQNLQCRQVWELIEAETILIPTVLMGLCSQIDYVKDSGTECGQDFLRS